MTQTAEWELPHTTLNWLERLPIERPVCLLLRHSVRGPLPANEDGSLVPLTESGIYLARQLGKVLDGRLRTLHTSPVLRCLQTATALVDGAGKRLCIKPDPHLGAPGVYVLNEEIAWENWLEMGHERVMAHLVSGNNVLPGMADPKIAAPLLVRHMLDVAEGVPGIHVFVTHDSLVTATVARLLGKKLTTDDWPAYLEGAFFWQEQSFLNVAYRNWTRKENSLLLYEHDESHINESHFMSSST